MATFNASVYLPPSLPLPQGVFRLHYSVHAKERILDNKYGRLSVPGELDTSKAKMVEVELDNKGICKIVYRIPMDDYFDLCLAIIPKDVFFVKTVWANRWNDNHSTIKKIAYAKL